jgi:hypothetical protein
VLAGYQLLNIPAGTGMDFLLKNNTNGTGIELLKNFYISLVLILESGQG